MPSQMMASPGLVGSGGLRTICVTQARYWLDPYHMLSRNPTSDLA